MSDVTYWFEEIKIARRVGFWAGVVVGIVLFELGKFLFHHLHFIK